VCAAYRRLLANGHLRRKNSYSTSSTVEVVVVSLLVGILRYFTVRCTILFHHTVFYYQTWGKNTHILSTCSGISLYRFISLSLPLACSISNVSWACVSLFRPMADGLLYLPIYLFFLSPPSPNLITCSFVWYYSYDNLQYMRNAVRKYKLRIL